MRRLGVIAFVAVGLNMLSGIPEQLETAVTIWTSPRFGIASRVSWAGYIASVLVVGLFLLIARNWLSSMLFDDDPLNLDVDATSLLHVVIVAISVFMVTSGVQSMMYKVVGIVGDFAELIFTGVRPDYYLSDLQRMLYPITEIIVGITLIIVAGKLARALIPRATPQSSPPREPDA